MIYEPATATTHASPSDGPGGPPVRTTLHTTDTQTSPRLPLIVFDACVPTWCDVNAEWQVLQRQTVNHMLSEPQPIPAVVISLMSIGSGQGRVE